MGYKMKFYGNQTKYNKQGNDFAEVVDIDDNHSIVIGTIRKGKTSAILMQSSDKESVKHLFGNRVSALHQEE